MGVMDAVGKDALSSLTGNVPKAILVVRNIKENSGDWGDVRKKLLDQANAGKAASQDSLLKRAASALSGSQVFSATASMLKNTGFVAMGVQYNPSGISMETVAGEQVDYSGGVMGSKANNMIVQSTQPGSTTMNFQLVFDDMNIYDSFMMSGFTVSSGNIVQAGKNLASKVKKEGYSVQKQVEGILALLTMEQTRQVMVFWSKMCFCGELTSVQAEYTMFNTSGNPVRANVYLSIRQGDDEDFYDANEWENAFDTYFKETGGGAASIGARIAQNNILNWTV